MTTRTSGKTKIPPIFSSKFTPTYARAHGPGIAVMRMHELFSGSVLLDRRFLEFINRLLYNQILENFLKI